MNKFDNYSVLMTVYQKDNPSYVRRSIDSMLAQTVLTNDFVIVCDGPLTPELDSLLADYTSKNKFFNIVRLDKNEGLGFALNKGVQICKNDLIARMDDDDIALENRCEMELSEFEKDPELDICGSFMNEFEDEKNTEYRLKSVPQYHEDICSFAKRRNPFNHSTVMFKKDRILQIGNYLPIRTNQDVELWVRSLNSGLKGYNIPQPLVLFRFDELTYKRRRDKKNIDLMIELWKEFYKKGYCSKKDYKSVAFKQRVTHLMPVWLIKWCYNHLR